VKNKKKLIVSLELDAFKLLPKQFQTSNTFQNKKEGGKYLSRQGSSEA
jgi:hypothetical protein